MRKASTRKASTTMRKASMRVIGIVTTTMRKASMRVIGTVTKRRVRVLQDHSQAKRNHLCTLKRSMPIKKSLPVT